MGKYRTNERHKYFFRESFITEMANILDELCPPIRMKRRRISSKEAVIILLNILENNISWNRYTLLFNRDTTSVFRRFQKWYHTGTWNKALCLFRERYIQTKKRCKPSWFQNLYIDCSFIKNLYGYRNDYLDRNPTDRGRLGTKISLICDRESVPLSFSFHVARCSDVKTVSDVVERLPDADKLVPDRRRHIIIAGDKGFVSEGQSDDLKHGTRFRLLTEQKKSGGGRPRKDGTPARKSDKPCKPLAPKEREIMSRRHCVENAFCTLDKFKRLVHRYDNKISSLWCFHVLAMCKIYYFCYGLA